MFRLTIFFASILILTTCGMDYRKSKKEKTIIANNINMILIPAGRFEMGLATLRQNFDFLKPFAKDYFLRCDDDPLELAVVSSECQHTVYLDEYRIDKHEVTNKEYDECVKAKKCTPAHRDDKKCRIINKSYLSCTSSPDDDDVCSPSSKGVSVFNDEETGEFVVGAILPDTFRGENQPVVCVDWYQAKQYCEWRGKRLPTEAEWEKAAKGGRSTLYPWGDKIKDICRYANVRNITLPDGSHTCGLPNRLRTMSIDSLKPNGYGLYDMTGNVAEWVSDWYGEYGRVAHRRNPKGSYEKEIPKKDKNKVIKGGSWQDFNPKVLIISNRSNLSPNTIIDTVGFRCVE